MSVTTTTSTQFGSPHRKAGPARAAQGRRCQSPGCATILSTYNAEMNCYLHSTARPKHPLASNR